MEEMLRKALLVLPTKHGVKDTKPET